jgi:hypothetical protein
MKLATLGIHVDPLAEGMVAIRKGLKTATVAKGALAKAIHDVVFNGAARSNVVAELFTPGGDK